MHVCLLHALFSALGFFYAAFIAHIYTLDATPCQAFLSTMFSLTIISATSYGLAAVMCGFLWYLSIPPLSTFKRGPCIVTYIALVLYSLCVITGAIGVSLVVAGGGIESIYQAGIVISQTSSQAILFPIYLFEVSLALRFLLPILIRILEYDAA
jgi:hypothetical protein